MGYKRTILIQLPGLRTDLFRKLLREKALVNINSLFIENGNSFEIISYAGGSHRAVTGAILTGKHPSLLNIPSLPPYSYKNKKVERIPGDLIKMAAEIKEEHLYKKFKSPVNVYSLLSFPDSNLGFWDRKKRNWYFTYGKKNNHWEMVDRTVTKTLIRLLNKDHDLYHVTYHALDRAAAIYGNDAERFNYQMDLLDYNLGLILEHLKEKGELENTLIVLTASRSYASVSERQDLCALFNPKEEGIKCSSRGASGDVQVLAVQEDKAFAQLYFRDKDKKWDVKPRLSLNAGRLVGLAEKLINSPAIDQIMVRTDNNHVKIIAKWGASVLRWNQERIFYDVISGNDPFNLNNRKNSWSANDSYDITRKSRYPDVLWQVKELFSHQNAGQMLINGKRGFVFGSEKKKAITLATGSLNTDHLMVPLMINTRNHTRIRRPADIYNAIANAMGFSYTSEKTERKVRRNRDGGRKGNQRYGKRRPNGKQEHKKNRG
jgi:hypothetical protein